MKKIYTNILLGCAVMLLVSCGRNYPPNVDSRTNVYKQLSTANNGEVDSLVKKVQNIKETLDHNKPLKIVRTSDEMDIITAFIEASIDGELNADSLGMTAENTIFLSSNDNVGNVNFSTEDSIFVKKGYYEQFRRSITGYKFSDASEIWRAASNNYIVDEARIYNDSITEERKKSVELAFDDNLQILRNLKYVIFEEDALLIPPVVEIEKKGFTSGYVLTHLYAYDIETQKKVGQTMLVSSNTDEISYTSFSEGSNISQFEGNMITGQLRMNLIGQKAKMIDSIFIKKPQDL
ncbi:hypothetical protein [uncultured Kordia sp.]|uniref:hypothetical protein n=1 Tax=uncultured Kordia sp. TaxID=507699 RepID=UPI002620481C|nr:hypothetical protein [uncultured Kordia sp.]